MSNLKVTPSAPTLFRNGSEIRVGEQGGESYTLTSAVNVEICPWFVCPPPDVAGRSHTIRVDQKPNVHIPSPEHQGFGRLQEPMILSNRFAISHTYGSWKEDLEPPSSTFLKVR